MKRKPKFTPVVKIVDGKMGFVAESGKFYPLDDFPTVSKARRAATIDNRSATEIIAALQADDENE